MIQNHINDHLAVVRNSFSESLIKDLERAGDLIAQKIKIGGKVIIFGNGGSAADAQHLAAEFISKLDKNRISLPALALTVDTSALTAISNDYGFEFVFERQLSSLCQKSDVVIGISTSGKSMNVLNGLRKANQIGATTIGFSGVDGIKDFNPDFTFRAASKITARIQEVHIIYSHLLCAQAERCYV